MCSKSDKTANNPQVANYSEFYHNSIIEYEAWFFSLSKEEKQAEFLKINDDFQIQAVAGFEQGGQV